MRQHSAFASSLRFRQDTAPEYIAQHPVLVGLEADLGAREGAHAGRPLPNHTHWKVILLLAIDRRAITARTLPPARRTRRGSDALRA